MPASVLSREPRVETWKGKGKQRDFFGRDDDPAGPNGVILDLQLIDDYLYQATYVVPISLGPGLNKFLVQVDTGSSDLWIASSACTSSICAQAGGHTYDPSRAIPSGQLLHIVYAEGEADGPIVWDSVQLGGYGIDNQALVAASTVNSEPLSSSFNGVLGLALPSNSLIAQRIAPGVSDAPDGATLVSNLFGITPVSTAPGARFFSLALERPGSDKVPSLLGIGIHPADLVPDLSKIEYDVLYTPSSRTPLWWQASVRAITVFVDGVVKPVTLSTTTPTAILDSGVPLIITTPAIANGIYGALGIGPASDGNYYIPCTTPLNLTIQLDDRSAIPLHPLDLSYYPPKDASSDTCVSSIQTFDYLGIPPEDATADMILGVPFLRNTYTVMAYDEPYQNGTFPLNTPNADELESVRPRLGLLSLTEPAIAIEEFNQVRVMKQPLGAPNSAANSHSSGGKGLSVGIEVLIGLLGFFGLCIVLFGARWAYMKRKYARSGPTGSVESGLSDGKSSGSRYAYHLTAIKSDSDYSGPSEDELRQRRFEAYKRKHMNSQYTDDTGITYVEDGIGGGIGVGSGPWADEFGAIKIPDIPWTNNDATLFNGTPVRTQSRPGSYFDYAPGEFFTQLPPPPRIARRSSHSPAHARMSSGAAIDAPLLPAHLRSDSSPRASADVAEGETDMAGVGSARGRGSTLGSPVSSYRTSPPSPGAQSYHSRTMSHAVETQAQTDVALESERSADPPATPPPLLPPKPVALDTLDTPHAVVQGAVSSELSLSMSASRMSLQGHES